MHNFFCGDLIRITGVPPLFRTSLHISKVNDMAFVMSSTCRMDINLSPLFPKGTYNTFTNDQFFKRHLPPYSYWPVFVMNVAEIIPCYSQTKELDWRCI